MKRAKIFPAFVLLLFALTVTGCGNGKEQEEIGSGQSGGTESGMEDAKADATRGYYGITSCIYLTNLETGAGEIVINGEEMAQLVKEELPVISVVFEFRVEEGGELIQTPKLPIPVVLK